VFDVKGAGSVMSFTMDEIRLPLHDKEDREPVEGQIWTDAGSTTLDGAPLRYGNDPLRSPQIYKLLKALKPPPLDHHLGWFPKRSAPV
jgi:hypothetical protein